MDVRVNLCFHCGLAIPEGVTFEVEYENQPVSTCCPGCQAVVNCILEGGLSDFYRYRTAYAEPLSLSADQQLQSSNWQHFDQQDSQQGFVRDLDLTTQRVELQVQGMVCAACVWLLQHKLELLPGISRVYLNFEKQFLQLDLDKTQTKVSEVFSALEACGYRPHPWIEDAVELRREQESNQQLKRLLVAGFAAMQVMMLTLGLYSNDLIAGGSYSSLMKWVSLIFATAVVFYSAYPFFSSAFRDFKNRTLGMDVPVALAIAVAYSASLIATIRGEGPVYYESVTMFCFLLLLGRYLEMRVRWKMAKQDQNLSQLLPLNCRLKKSEKETWVTPWQLQTGDLVIIKAGDRVPVDGKVVVGEGYFDESVLTGEFVATRHQLGETVLAGSILNDGYVEIKVLKPVQNSAISVILDLMSRTKKQKSQTLSLAHKVASMFVSGILMIAVMVSVFWWLTDPAMVLPVLVSLLVVSCPCALSLASPLAYTAASLGLRKQRILLMSNRVLEDLFNVTDLVFDKTGTLTQGKISIGTINTHSIMSEFNCRSLAAGLERASAHPIAFAFKAIEATAVENIQVFSGQGITGEFQGMTYAIGSQHFAMKFCHQPVSKVPLEAEQQRLIYLADSQQILASFSLIDPLKSDVVKTFQHPWIRKLKRHLLSGDTSSEVQALGKRLAFDHIQSGMSAVDKKNYVESLSDSGQFTLTVGDGVNDGPVLAASGVSIAVADATSLAQSRADVAFLQPGMKSLEHLYGMAIRTRRIIRQNYSWAIGYNVIAIPLAATGMLVPWIAALGMSLSSLLVLFNAMRLLRTSSLPAAEVA